MNFVENEIAEGKYSKMDFDKSKILHDIIVSAFADLSDSEQKWLENQIQHLIDNKLVNFFKRLQFIKKRSYDIFKVSIKLMDHSIKIICNKNVQSTISLLGQIPFDGLTYVGQLVVYSIGPKIGLSIKVISIILSFL